jgi:hypothetical protein
MVFQRKHGHKLEYSYHFEHLQQQEVLEFLWLQINKFRLTSKNMEEEK